MKLHEKQDIVLAYHLYLISSHHAASKALYCELFLWLAQPIFRSFIYIIWSLTFSLRPPSEPCVYLCSKPSSFLILYISKETWATNLHNPECTVSVCVCADVYWNEHWLILCIPTSNYPNWPGNRAHSMSKRKKLVTHENGTDKNQ